MKFITLVAAGAALSAMLCGTAFAASMEARFGNTMLGTRPDGTVLKIFYNKDHTFSGELTPPGSTTPLVAKGTWRIEGKNLCLTPLAGPDGKPSRESCALLKGDKVGDKWQTEVRGPDGQPVVQTVEIVKGR